MHNLPLAKHLALYAAFHRDPANQRVHHLASPFVYLTALIGLAVVAPWALAPVVVASLVALAVVDAPGALVFAAQAVPEALLAHALATHVPAAPLLASAAVVHVAAWAVLVFVGHRAHEPHLVVGGASVDSGEYFRRHFNLARGLGCRVNLIDVALQFSIAPLAHANEWLFGRGLRPGLAAQVRLEREALLARLALGATPFVEADGALSLRPTSPLG